MTDNRATLVVTVDVSTVKQHLEELSAAFEASPELAVRFADDAARLLDVGYDDHNPTSTFQANGTLLTFQPSQLLRELVAAVRAAKTD